MNLAATAAVAALAATAAVAALVVALACLGMALSWRGRARRTAHLPAPDPVPDGIGSPRTTVTGLHVATTIAGEPLNRVVAAGLGFRARAHLAVHETGLVVELTGTEPFHVPLSRIRSVDRATWTIDKVVEGDGLTRLQWQLGDTMLDTYFRVEGNDDALITATAAGGFTVAGTQ